MRIRSAFVVVLSLAALAAAVQFFVSTPPAAPDASSTDDIDAAPPGIPPAPVLATSPARSCEVAPLTGTGGAQEASPDASVSRPVRRPPPLEPATQAPTSKFDLYYDLRSAADDDLVVLRIRAETKRLSDVDDERAAGYVDLSDSQYAKRREAERAAGGEDLQRRWIDAPDRTRLDVERWMLEPVDISQYEERLRNFIEPFVVGTRRRAAREYRFEVARLRSEWLRGFSDRRREMRSVTTAADAVEFRSAVREWDRRKRAWIERDGDVDGSDLDDLVRTIPGRCWLPPTGERLRELLDEAAALGLTEEGG